MGRPCAALIRVCVLRVLTAFSLLVLVQAGAAAAQPATLVADNLRMGPGGEIIAEGNVEVLQDGTRLRARRIIYNRSTDSLQIEGPLTLVQADGSVIQASAATLDSSLRDGIVESARIVLDDQMQIAAVESHRVGGRYNQLYKTVASTCRVCNGGPPLWQIRARRVVQDTEEKQLYFYDAWFDVGGVPLVYLPRLRLPDPSLRRATGFLTPEYYRSNLLGYGIKVPYFIVISPHADLKITPFVAENTRTVELRYRQALRNGGITLNGAISSDDLRPGQLRYYLTGDGQLSLPADFKLTFGGEFASDNAYASEHGYSGSDVLYSFAKVERVRRFEMISAGVSSYLPIVNAGAATNVQGELGYDRRIPHVLGGEVQLGFGVGVDGGAYQATADARWRDQWVFGPGVIGVVTAEVVSDYFFANAGAGIPRDIFRVTPRVAGELRWPLMRTTRGGHQQVLEPVMQLAWTDETGPAVPNRDGLVPEFDEGNLISLSRFPGRDAQERGANAALGFRWTHLGRYGTRAHLTAGRVIRFADLGQFTRASGLDGPVSDWLVAGSLSLGLLDLSSRAIFDDGFGVTKSATRIGLKWNAFDASGSHLWQVADAAEGRAMALHEFEFLAGYNFNKHWRGTVNARYDATRDVVSSAGFGVIYNNECLNVSFSYRRETLISAAAPVDSTFGLSVGLNGVGNDGRPFRRACRG
jgi:LPS-assembly protein